MVAQFASSVVVVVAAGSVTAADVVALVYNDFAAVKVIAVVVE